ncbi:DUF4386 family protein [Alteromonas sp. A079]|uniref:DUF4386 family protein n=1 Tax=Alteromonas sp. A079 TaxID=3410268 RepID=UPI003BA39F6D
MSPNRAGGIASIICATTYIFGFVFFFGVLDAPIDNSDTGRLQFLVGQRDVFFLGYIIIGVVFSLSLLLVNQSLHRIFKNVSPAIASYNATLGVIWASFVLASTFVFLVSLSFLADYANVDESGAVIALKATSVVVDALGGGIELLGALWVLLISYVCLKANIYHKATHVLGVAVGVAGMLTLLTGLSFLSEVVLFEATAAVFGLGQIVWFIALGIHLLNDSGD